MIMQKFVAWVLLSALLTGWTSIARAEDIDHDGEEDHFIELKAGETATEDGFFFTAGALSQVIAKQESKLSLLENNKNTEIKKLELNIETITKKKDVELAINKEMYESLLKIRQDRIDELSSARKWDDLKLVAGFAAGFVVSIAIFYAAVKVTK